LSVQLLSVNSVMGLRVFLCLGWLLGSAPAVFAQQTGYAGYQGKQTPSRQILMEMGFGASIPRGAFAQEVSKTGFGLHMMVGYRLAHLPLELAVSLDAVLYGYQTDQKPLGSVNPASYELVLDRYQYMLPLHAHLRYAPSWGKIAPFAEAFGGMRLISTRTTARGNQLIAVAGNPEAFSSKATYNDFTVSYGLGAGIHYKLADVGNLHYRLQLSARWLNGGKANYLGVDDLVIQDNQLVYQPRFSETSVVALNLGLSILF